MENQKPKHQRRSRYKGTHPRTFKRKIQRTAAGKVRGYHRKGNPQRKYPGGYAYFYLRTGNFGLFADTARTAGTGRNPGIWGTQRQNAGVPRQEGHLYALDVDPIEM